jgi:hypothetical protein
VKEASMFGATRREFLGAAGAAVAGAALGRPLGAQETGERPAPPPGGVRVLNPRTRVPLSFIIDDSTCLVNLSHFAIPQFAEVNPNAYKQDWRKLPREIPDAFVRKFMEYGREHGVKGKYSIVPYPACVGWIDREMPGWTRKELEESLKLVRDFVTPNWDIHPEMVSHTWGIDTKTGRPYPDRTEKNMENWGFSVGRSADFMADYLSFALRLLKNAGLPCEGITTPGGFGGRSRPALAQGTLQACRDVYKVDVAHYFRDLFTDKRSVAPIVQYAEGLETDDPRCVVHVIGCTGDWTGGWDGLEEPAPDKFITEDLKGGRLPEIIARGEPAILVCHWPGIYHNGDEAGFKAFQVVVGRLEAGYKNLLWMKNAEIARYWAARECTRIQKDGGKIALRAPFACPVFTVEAEAAPAAVPKVFAGEQPVALREVPDPLKLEAGTWTRGEKGVTVCFDLPKGPSRIELG